MDLPEWPHRLKSARRKKRLVKKDRDKQLIKIDKLQSSLLHQKRHLPMIPLKHPYQKGWKRLFVLREDIKRSTKAEFYEGLLSKINTVRYHYDKSFKKKKRRKLRYHYEEKPQMLREISADEWYHNKLKLTEAEMACFYCKQEWSASLKRVVISYVFDQAWHFVLVVKPHIIYQVKMMDEVLEQQLGAIDNYISNNHLWPKIRKLTNGRGYHRRGYTDKPKYINEFKNKPRYTDKEAYEA